MAPSLQYTFSFILFSLKVTNLDLESYFLILSHMKGCQFWCSSCSVNLEKSRNILNGEVFLWMCKLVQICGDEYWSSSRTISLHVVPHLTWWLYGCVKAEWLGCVWRNISLLSNPPGKDQHNLRVESLSVSPTFLSSSFFSSFRFSSPPSITETSAILFIRCIFLRVQVFRTSMWVVGLEYDSVVVYTFVI